ncbi:hypothetical protein [Sporichthya polymorpha]|uniref:hypothetical protein n=1 Tax=Sporichthya polymorpha TaxID=35751 RepID=UPI001FE029F1|nr:hypothetical protein [Sporichthya polymorpha]
MGEASVTKIGVTILNYCHEPIETVNAPRMLGGKSMRFLRSAAAGVLAVGLATLGPGAAPVSAHSGGKAVVLVADLTLSPEGSGWKASTTLVDGDSGEPLRGIDIKALLGSPVKTVTLVQGSTLGNYVAPLGALPVGPTHLELKVRTLPGAEPVVPFDKGWDFTLTAGQPVEVASETVGERSGNVALILSAAGAVILIALLYGLFSMRRRTQGLT